MKRRGNNFLLRLFALFVFISCAGIISFMYGMVVGNYRLFPYRYLRAAADQAIFALDMVKRPTILTSELISSQSRQDANAIAIDRSVDSVLLPLKIRSVPLNRRLSLAATAGGIAAVGDSLIVMDRLGKFYACANDCATVSQIVLPPLPNHIMEFVSEYGSTLDEAHFRAHGVRYSSAEGMLAVSYESFDVDLRKTRPAVSVIRIDAESLQPSGAWDTVFLGDPEPEGSNIEGGGVLAWGPDGKLYLTVGAYGLQGEKVAQDPISTFGKIIAIDVRKKSHRNVSIGHRNSEGLAMTETFGLLSTDQGPKGGDRLNIVVDGTNHGWPNVSLGTDYDKYSLVGTKDVGTLEDYAEPLFAWLPSIAPTGLIEVRGFNHRWDGDVLVASLKGESLFRLRVDNSRVVYSEPIYIGKRIRDIVMARPGVIALWTDDAQVIFMSVDQGKLNQDRVLINKAYSNTMIYKCMYCHHFGDSNESDFAPTLTGLLGRRIASDRYRYSDGLRAVQGEWNPEKLRRFVTNPSGFASGTTMPQLGLATYEIDEVVHDFERQA